MRQVELPKKMQVSIGLPPDCEYFEEKRLGRRNYCLYLTIEPVVFRSLAICGIDGTKVPDTKTEKNII